MASPPSNYLIQKNWNHPWLIFTHSLQNISGFYLQNTSRIWRLFKNSTATSLLSYNLFAWITTPASKLIFPFLPLPSWVYSQHGNKVIFLKQNQILLFLCCKWLLISLWVKVKVLPMAQINFSILAPPPLPLFFTVPLTYRHVPHLSLLHLLFSFSGALLLLIFLR